jgi:hypothetical protein
VYYFVLVTLPALEFSEIIARVASCEFFHAQHRKVLGDFLVQRLAEYVPMKHFKKIWTTKMINYR